MTHSVDKKISVIVPNYNYARYLKKRIKTIIRQKYPIFELIILDDCSTDNSREIIECEIKKIKRKHPEIIVKKVFNKKNSGKAIIQWKKGVEMATGDYIWIAEADDLCSRNFLRRVMAPFEESNVTISYTESKIIDKNGFILAPNFRWSRDKEKTGRYKKSYIKNGIDEIREIFAIRCAIPNVSAVVFRKNKDLADFMQEAIKYNQVGDWYIYLKLLECGSIAYEKRSLNKYRIHRGSVTRKSQQNSAHMREIFEIHDLVKNKYKLNEKTLNYMADEESRISVKCDII